MNKFLKLLKDKKPILFDGAFGTQLLSSNISLNNNPPEFLNIINPEIVKNIHKEYVIAGSQVITTNTFGANSSKLSQYGLEEKQAEIISKAVKLTRESFGKKPGLVAGSIGPIGKLISPIGDLSFDDAKDIYAEQVECFNDTDVDLIIIETMQDIQDARACLLACKENTDLPVIVSMTFEDGLRSTTGTPPEVFAYVMSKMGADAIGANCSTGPDEMQNVLDLFLRVTDIPIMIQANAGMPKQIGNKTVFPMSPESYFECAKILLDSGVSIIGGCCGTTPEHIKLLREYIDSKDGIATQSEIARNDIKLNSDPVIFASRSKLFIQKEKYPIVIGERINPNAQKKVKSSVIEQNYSYLIKEAEDQMKQGADLIDINVSVANIDEVKVIEEVVKSISSVINIPICIDSPDPFAIESALKNFPGIALINSTNAEKERMDKILPLAKKYGASIICLALDEEGIPDTIEARVKVAGKVIEQALRIGIKSRDIFVDTLVLAVATDPMGVIKTLESLKIVSEKYNVNTVLGVSNISFGLPERQCINAAFISMAIYSGLNALIINPGRHEIMGSFKASLLLSGKDRAAEKYLEYFHLKEKKEEKPKDVEVSNDLKTLILKGNKHGVLDALRSELESRDPVGVIKEVIIPTLDLVGHKYEAGEYFLPQLLFSSEACKIATEYLENILRKDDKKIEYKATIVFATVKDDLHDIGKNIIISILKNYGYKIVDAGKNVTSDTIIDLAEKNNAGVIALSALMTSTMNNMEDLIIRLKERKLKDKYKVIVGGAVLNTEYANKIGADGYSHDAIGTVKLLEKLGF